MKVSHAEWNVSFVGESTLAVNKLYHSFGMADLL